MIHITSTVTIYRPLAQVFDFISAADNDFEWQYGTLASGQISGGGGRVGASFRTIGHLMGRRMQSTYEVTEYEADRRYGFKSLSGPLHSQTTYTVETVEGSTRMKVATEAVPANALQVQEAVLEKFMQKQLKDDLALLKAILEAR
jgi:polyketide cyclase/dehydrase/lipid transport protein